MPIYDNGWYRIIGIKIKHAHYFFNDEPLHVLNHGVLANIDYSKRFTCNRRLCKRCISILQAYSKIGLQNRLK